VTFATSRDLEEFKLCDGVNRLDISEYGNLYMSMVQQNLIPALIEGETTFTMPDRSDTVPPGIRALAGAGNLTKFPYPQKFPIPSFDFQGDFYVSQIAYFQGDTPPAGWLVCDGTFFPAPQNNALFSLIGFKFGQQGNLIFGLPNLLEAVTTPLGSLPLIAAAGLYPPTE
jgi:microcystin-dependent protein